jgi:pyruvate dehydrogenase E1 component beta subunit
MTTLREQATAAEPQTLAYAAALNQALDEALSADPRVFLLGEDLADPAGVPAGRATGRVWRHNVSFRFPASARW